jgi:hypothetical protein
MGQRTAALSLVVGGALLALEYLFWTVESLTPDRVTAPPGSVTSTLVLLAVGSGALLLTLGVPTLMARQRRRAGVLGATGGWLLVVGFLLWTLSILGSLSILGLPWWLPDADQVMLALGAALFGLASYAASILPARAALLVAIGGLVGMLPAAIPDLLFFGAGVDVGAGSGPLRTIGYVALVLFGVGWAWLGFGVWPSDRGSV